MAPPKKHSFQKKWFLRISGLLFIGLAVFLALSLFSYNDRDPSFNRSVDDDVTNWGGVVGAYIADPLLQFLGLSSGLLVIFSLAYGIRLIVKPAISLWWLRIIMMLLCLISAASMLAMIDLSESWSFLISFGGWIGEFIQQKSLHFMTPLIFLTASTILFILSFFLAIGMTTGEWVSFIRIVTRRLQWCARIIVAVVALSYHFIRLVINRFNDRPADDDDAIESVAPSHRPVAGSPVEKRREVKTLSDITSNFRKKAVPAIERHVSTARIPSDFELPALSLLSPVIERARKNPVSETTLNQNARQLEKVLEDFGVYGKITQVHPGPVVTLYELEPAAGTKSSRVIGLADDIARSMCSISTRIAVIPGRNAIGIELPNTVREIVYLRELIEGVEYAKEEYRLPIALGKNIAGEAVIADLSRMPHLLVAGTTGSGKSVAINTMILSFLYRMSPEQCKFIMIDPKMLELSVYDGIPHLLAPVVTDPSKAVVALKWTTKEMEERYRKMSNLGVRNIASYNKRIEEAASNGELLERTVQTGFDPDTGKPIIEKVPFDMTPLPFIVVVVDEMADLMLVAGKDIESSIQRLAQMARAAGIHIIMATQRPSVDVITGVIKANFPTRISFQVTSRIDSRTILGEQGAEQLLGMGDMLYMAGGGRVSRVHGPFVDDKEVEKVVSFLKTQSTPSYINAITEDVEEPGGNYGDMDSESSGDSIYDEAVAIVSRDRKASTSYIQRCLKIGYNRAATIIERMEREGVVSRANHVGKREVLVPEMED